MDNLTDQKPETKTESQFDIQDVEKNKVMAVVAYIIFLIPLLAVKDSAYVKFHTNQGLVLFLAAIIINVVGTIIPILGWLLILPLGNLAVCIFAVLGIVNAATGKAKPLPFIGDFKLIK